MAFGRFLGMGEDYHPLLWSMPTYDTDQSGNVVNLDKNSRLATRGADEGAIGKILKAPAKYTTPMVVANRPFFFRPRRVLFDASHVDTIKSNIQLAIYNI